MNFPYTTLKTFSTWLDSNQDKWIINNRPVETFDTWFIIMKDPIKKVESVLISMVLFVETSSLFITLLNKFWFNRQSFSFLDPKNLKDKEKRRPDEEGFDPTTLYVPESFLKDQTVSLIEIIFFLSIRKFWLVFQVFFSDIVFLSQWKS